MDRREVITKCMEMGVPIFQGRIDKTLFLASLKDQGRRPADRAGRRSLGSAPTKLESRLHGRCRPQPAPTIESGGVDGGSDRHARRAPRQPARRRSPTSSRWPSKKHAKLTAMRYKAGDEWVDVSYEELGDDREGGLARPAATRDRARRQGRDPRPHPPRMDLLGLRASSARARRCPVYQTNSPEECQYVIDHSESKAVIVEDAEPAREDPRGPRPASEARAR